MPSKRVEARKRGPRHNIAQKRFLVEYMRSHPNFANGRSLTSSERHAAEKHWTELTIAMNSKGPKKSISQWHKVWKDLKTRTRAKAIAILTAKNERNVAKKDIPHLTGTEKILLSMIGYANIEDINADTASETSDIEYQLKFENGEIEEGISQEISKFESEEVDNSIYAEDHENSVEMEYTGDTEYGIPSTESPSIDSSFFLPIHPTPSTSVVTEPDTCDTQIEKSEPQKNNEMPSNSLHSSSCLKNKMEEDSLTRMLIPMQQSQINILESIGKTLAIFAQCEETRIKNQHEMENAKLSFEKERFLKEIDVEKDRLRIEQERVKVEKERLMFEREKFELEKIYSEQNIQERNNL